MPGLIQLTSLVFTSVMHVHMPYNHMQATQAGKYLIKLCSSIKYQSRLLNLDTLWGREILFTDKKADANIFLTFENGLQFPWFGTY